MRVVEEIFLSSKIEKFMSRRKVEGSEIIPMGKWATYEYIPSKMSIIGQRKKIKSKQN